MSRTRYRYDKDLECMVEVGGNYFEERGQAPSVISDELGVRGVYNPGTGRTYDSKSRYYADTKAQGKHIVEPGESQDGMGHRRQSDAILDKGRARDIKTAIEQLKAGYRGH